jgi:uncharacterized lipoprotein YajG
MKKLALLTAALLFTGAVAMSQTQETEQTPQPIKETVTTPEQAAHGQNISEIARETQDGQIISEAARVKGETMKEEKLSKRDQRKAEAQARRAQRPERPQAPERPARPERPSAGRP